MDPDEQALWEERDELEREEQVSDTWDKIGRSLTDDDEEEEDN
jgi:hypothetical protein